MKLDLIQEPSVNTSVRYILMGETHSFSDEWKGKESVRNNKREYNF